MTSGLNTPLLAVSTSTAPSPTTRLSRPFRFWIRTRGPSASWPWGGGVLGDAGPRWTRPGEWRFGRSAGEQVTVVPDEVAYGSRPASGELFDIRGDVLGCAGAEHREHLRQVTGLPVAQPPRPGGVPGLLRRHVQDLDVGTGLLRDERRDRRVGRCGRAGEHVVATVVPGIGEHGSGGGTVFFAVQGLIAALPLSLPIALLS